MYKYWKILRRILNEKEKEEKKKLKSAAKELEKLNGAKTTKEEVSK